MASSFETRLQALETRDKGNTRDILRLKKEVVELQTTVYELKEENGLATVKMQEMEIQLRQMKNDLTDVYDFKDNILSRLDCLESNVNHLQDNHDRVSQLETAMNEAKQDVSKCSKLCAERIAALEWKQKKQRPLHETYDEEETPVKRVADMKQGSTKQGMSDLLERVGKEFGASDKEETLVKTVVGATNVWRKESTIPVMSFVVDRLENIEKQTQENHDSIKLLEKIKESAIQVHLRPSQELAAGKIVKLDTCEWVSSSADFFDMTSCCLQPQIDGNYILNISFVQAGKGEVMIWAKNDGWPNEFYIGKTVSDNDVSSVVHVFSLMKGQKIWLEACRVEGNAQTAGCYLYCWLLQPF